MARNRPKLKRNQPSVGERISFRAMPRVIETGAAPDPMVAGVVLTRPARQHMASGFYSVQCEEADVPADFAERYDLLQYVARKDITGVLPADMSRTAVEEWLAD